MLNDDSTTTVLEDWRGTKNKGKETDGVFVVFGCSLSFIDAARAEAGAAVASEAASMKELDDIVSGVAARDAAGAAEAAGGGEGTGLAGVDRLAQVAELVGALGRIEGQRVSRFGLEGFLGGEDVVRGEVVVGGGDRVARGREEERVAVQHSSFVVGVKARACE